MPMKREPVITGLSDIFFSSYKHPRCRVFYPRGRTQDAGCMFGFVFFRLAHILLGRFWGEEENGYYFLHVV